MDFELIRLTRREWRILARASRKPLDYEKLDHNTVSRLYKHGFLELDGEKKTATASALGVDYLRFWRGRSHDSARLHFWDFVFTALGAILTLVVQRLTGS